MNIAYPENENEIHLCFNCTKNQTKYLESNPQWDLNNLSGYLYHTC